VRVADRHAAGVRPPGGTGVGGHGTGPTVGHLFAFRGRRGDRLKLLYWDRDGYALWYKRLEEGTFRLPKIDDPEQRSVELRASELAMLLDGIDLRSVRRSKRYHRRP
jgi:transposase